IRRYICPPLITSEVVLRFFCKTTSEVISLLLRQCECDRAGWGVRIDGRGSRAAAAGRATAAAPAPSGRAGEQDEILTSLRFVADRPPARPAREAAGPQNLAGVLVIRADLSVAAGVKHQAALRGDDPISRADAAGVRRASRAHRRRMIA